MLAYMDYGLIERLSNGTETVLTFSYNASSVPPLVGQTLKFASEGESRMMLVLEIAERPKIKEGLQFVIVQPA